MNGLVEATSREELMPFTRVSKPNDLQTILTLSVVRLKQILRVENDLGLPRSPEPLPKGTAYRVTAEPQPAALHIARLCRWLGSFAALLENCSLWDILRLNRNS